MNQAKEFLQYIFNAIKIWVIVQPWELGIRVRNGKNIKKLTPGLYFKIPYFDSIFVQECRLRICGTPMQNTTTKDLKTITLSSSIGFSIYNIEKLYNTLFHPETSIRNIAMSEVSGYIFNRDINDISPNEIEIFILNKLKETDYGLKFEYFKITNFAIVRTYRLIQDHDWVSENVKMNISK